MQTRTEQETTGTEQTFEAQRNGWRRAQTNEDQDRIVVRYWRRTGNPTTPFQSCTIFQDNDGWYSLKRSLYDKFGFHQSGYDLTGRPREDLDPVRRYLWEELDKRAGSEPFDSPPTFPDRVGQWTAVSRRNPMRWVYDPSHNHSLETPTDATEEVPTGAHYDVEVTDYTGGYGRSDPLCDVRYSDATGEEVICTGVLRRHALEIVTEALDVLKQPVADCDDRRSVLQAVDGIGPSKARSLLVLGVDSPDALAKHIEHDETVVNRTHSERVDALLTSRICSSIQ